MYSKGSDQNDQKFMFLISFDQTLIKTDRRKALFKPLEGPWKAYKGSYKPIRSILALFLRFSLDGQKDIRVLSFAAISLPDFWAFLCKFSRLGRWKNEFFREASKNGRRKDPNLTKS